MLCSVYVLSDCIEGFLFEEVSDKVQQQNEDYKKLSLKTPLQMFACLESNIPHNYNFNDNTKLLVLDVENNSRQIVENVPTLIQNILNKSNHLSHGKILYDYINHHLDDYISTYNNLDQIIQEQTQEQASRRTRCY